MSDSYTVTSPADDFIVLSNENEWVVYTSAETGINVEVDDSEAFIEIVAVGVNDAALAAAAAVAAEAAAVQAAASAAQALAALPIGGTTGQFLIKLSNTNFDYAWATSSGMLTAVYDPTNVAGDVFARANHTGTQLAATISNFSTAADARVSAAIGVSVQAYSANLVTWAGIAPSANVQSFVSAANYAVMRALLDLEAGTDFYSIAAADAAFQPKDADLTALAAAGNSAVLSATTASFLLADETKLDAIEALADVTDAGNVGSSIFGATAKTSLADADTVAITDSAASNVLKKITWTNFKAAIMTYFTATAKTTPIDADRVWQGNSTTSNTPVYSTWTQIKAFLKTYNDTLYQPVDSDLTTIAGLTATTDNFLVSVASAWASRTPAQAKTTLALVKADVGLANVDNTSDAGKPVSTAQQTALNLKANLASPTFTGTVAVPDDSFSLAKLVNIATARFLGRTTALAGDIEELTAAQATAMLSAMVGDAGSGGTKGLVPAPITGDSTKFLRGDGTFQAIAGGGDALTSGNLSQFAATTSLQLKNTISDETGSGALVFATSPALVTPTGIVKGDVGLGSVDNTADTTKPVSTAQQTALDLKAALAGAAFSGAVSATSLTQSGAQFTINNASGTIVFSDTVLTRDAAHTLAMRNGVNAQIFRTYNTYTDASNYERLEIGVGVVAAGHFGIASKSAGTGATRDIYIQAAARILFQTTGANNRWMIDGSGHFVALTDNTYDIGASGANRPRTIHIGTDIELGHATDTTISRSAAGVIAVEGVPLYSNIPQNSQSAAYTLVLADAQKHIYHPAADTTTRVWTIPANASVAFPIGTVITFDNDFGAGEITIAITTDTLVLVGTAGTTGSRTLASGGQATAVKVTSTRWRISGVGLT